MPQSAVELWKDLRADVERLTAAGLLEAAKKFRRVKGYRALTELERILYPLSTSQPQVA